METFVHGAIYRIFARSHRRNSPVFCTHSTLSDCPCSTDLAGLHVLHGSYCTYMPPRRQREWASCIHHCKTTTNSSVLRMVLAIHKPELTVVTISRRPAFPKTQCLVWISAVQNFISSYHRFCKRNKIKQAGKSPQEDIQSSTQFSEKLELIWAENKYYSQLQGQSMADSRTNLFMLPSISLKDVERTVITSKRPREELRSIVNDLFRAKRLPAYLDH